MCTTCYPHRTCMMWCHKPCNQCQHSWHPHHTQQSTHNDQSQCSSLHWRRTNRRQNSWHPCLHLQCSTQGTGRALRVSNIWFECSGAANAASNISIRSITTVSSKTLADVRLCINDGTNWTCTAVRGCGIRYTINNTNTHSTRAALRVPNVFFVCI